MLTLMKVDINDKNVYEYLSSGDDLRTYFRTTNSSGMQDLRQKAKALGGDLEDSVLICNT